MGTSVANEVLDNGLLHIKNNGDQMVLCATQPTTFAEAVDPPAWQASSAYATGAFVRPTTRNGFVYEVTAGGGGNSGASEPTWPTTPGNTVVDGALTWTCRANKSLVATAMTSGDFTVADGDVSGRKITSGAKNGIAAHASGDADHVVWLDTANQVLLHVTQVVTQTVTAPNPVNIPAFDYELRDPTIV